MFVVHVDLTVKDGLSGALAATYGEVFRPALMRQAGLSETKLLRARNSEARTHRLIITFASEQLQKQWAASDLHREVWTTMKQSIAGYSVECFELAEATSEASAKSRDSSSAACT